ncbi:MAG: peptidylprolyl isomerase [Thermoleophilia bacterium]|nr:peptidylprolyl isomerase [Thermoleophilia bacterium]
MTIDTSKRYRATLETSCGDIVIDLDAKAAPTTVNNFVFLAREGFYDGLTFHRVVPGFVIQGGDPAGDGTGGPGYQFEDELPSDGYPQGAVAMANAGPNTNGSQFFIVTGEAPLPNDYSRFGQVASGLDAAKRIEALAEPGTERPSQPVYIFGVKVTEG